MNFRFTFFAAILIITVFLLGCPNQPETTNTNIKNTTTTNTQKTDSKNNPFNTTKNEQAATTNNAPTVAPIVQAYYEALRKKDEAGVKKYLSAAALKYYEEEARAEKKNWLAFLLEFEEPLAEKREVRNEKIQGDTIIAEIKGGSLGDWTATKLVKENGEWKFASPRDIIGLQDIPRSTTNSNTGK